MARRLASSGYAVLVVNQYYRAAHVPLGISFSDFGDPDARARIMPLMAGVREPGGVERDARAFAAFLDGQASVDTARGIGTIAHSDPAEAGKVLQLCNPRLAVAFHFFNDFDTAPEMEREIRRNYSGPLALAKDLMCFNVTKERIVSRMTVHSSHVWPNKEHHDDFRKAPRKERMKMSRWLADRQLFPKF